LCVKEQLSLCYRLLTERGFTSNSTDGPHVLIEDLSHCQKYPLFKHSLPAIFHGPSLELNWVKVYGQTYKQRVVVLMRIEGTSELLPLFGSVELVLSKNDEILLVCKRLVTEWFNEDLHAYSAKISNEFECILVRDLHSPFPCIR